MRTRSHSPAPAAPACPRSSSTRPSRPRPWTRPARRSVLTRVRGQPELAAARRRSGDGAGVARACRATSGPRSWPPPAAPRRTAPHRADTERGLGRDDRVPGVRRRRARRGCPGVAAQQRARAPDRTGSRTACGRASRAAAGPADPVRDLDELRQLREPRGDRHSVARRRRASLGRPTARRRLRPPACTGTGSPSCRPAPGQRRVRLDHPVQLAGPGQRELQATRNRCNGGLPRPTRRSAAAAARDAPRLVVVLRDLRSMSSPNHLACS